MKKYLFRDIVPNDFQQIEKLLRAFDPDLILYRDQIISMCSYYNEGGHKWIGIYDSEKPKNLLGIGNLLIRPKLIHSKFGLSSYVGQIEEVVIDKDYRFLGLGKLIVDHLYGLAHVAGCYKVILYCLDKNIEFYNKCGFFEDCQLMRRNIQQ